ELSQRVCEGENHRRQNARPRQRQLDFGQRRRGRHATTGSGIPHLGRDRLEAPLHGLDRKRQVEDDGGDEKTLEREYELRAEHGMPNLPDRRSRAEGDKKIVAENGRWQHERERHERLDEALASELMVGQRSTSENADRQEDENRHHGKPE